MTVALALDSVIALLLVATIVYCVILNRRLGELRGNQGEFIKLIESFNAATERAQASISELREVGEEKGATLDSRVETARALCDDLVFLVERGSRLADRLEGASHTRDDAIPIASRLGATVAPGGRDDNAAARAGPDWEEGAVSVVERDLRDAIRGAGGA